MTTNIVKPFVIRHRNTKMFLAKNDKNPYKHGSVGVAKTIGAKGHYKWTWNIEEAIRYTNEQDADTDYYMMGEPPIDFIDVEK